MVNTLATCNLLEAFYVNTQIDRQTDTDTDAKAVVIFKMRTITVVAQLHISCLHIVSRGRK